jgi:hypothetical protein
VANPLLVGIFPPYWLSDVDSTTLDGNVVCDAVRPLERGRALRIAKQLLRWLAP